VIDESSEVVGPEQSSRWARSVVRAATWFVRAVVSASLTACEMSVGRSRRQHRTTLLQLLHVARWLALVMAMVKQLCGCAHLPADGLSFQQLSPQDAAKELRDCLETHGGDELLLLQNTSVVKSDWAGWLLQNASTPVVVGPLIPKDASTSLRIMFGDKNRPEALTSVPDFLQLRQDDWNHHRSSQEDEEAVNGEVPANRRFWFAVVRDPLSRLVDAYIQIGYWVEADSASGCSWRQPAKPNKGDDYVECVQPSRGRRGGSNGRGGDENGDVAAAAAAAVVVVVWWWWWWWGRRRLLHQRRRWG
jgi:hypothetical protein